MSSREKGRDALSANAQVDTQPVHKPKDDAAQAFEITVAVKIGGKTDRDNVLTKIVALEDGRDDAFVADGSHCWMSKGTGHRHPFTRMAELAKLIEDMPANKAVILGRL